MASGTALLPCQRDRFSIPRHVHYLNCAYLSPLAKSVERAGVAALRDRRVPTGFPPSRFFEQSDRLRERFARLIGAPDPGRVAIQPAVSYGISVAARNLSVERGQNIVLLEDQFPSNVYAWRRLAAERGLELRTVRRPRGNAATGSRWTERVLEAIDDATAAAALPQVHWTDGSLLDLEPIGERTRETGAALVVDGSQSVGAFPFSIERIRPDALVCAGYKWLFGPYSLSLAWYGPRFDDGVPLEETWIAREGSEDFRALVRYRDEYRPGAVRYDVGERSNFVLVPMQLAALELVLGWGPGRIQAYCRHLMEELLATLRERGARLDGEAPVAHIVGVRLPEGTDLRELSRRLESGGVHVSLRGDALRISPHLYNDEVDVDALSRTLVEML